MNSQAGRPQWSTRPAAQAQPEPAKVEPHLEQPAAAPVAAPDRPRRVSAGTAGHDLRQELEATVESRRELGPGYDALLIEAFLDRLDRTLDERIASRSGRRTAAEPAPQPVFTKEMIGGLAVTMIFGVPLTALGVENAGTPGLLAIWLPIAVIWLGILGYLPRPRR